jgi:hypothetical protein
MNDPMNPPVDVDVEKRSAELAKQLSYKRLFPQFYDWPFQKQAAREDARQEGEGGTGGES